MKNKNCGSIDLVSITRLIAAIGLGLCILGLALRIRSIMNRPYKKDLSRGRGDVRSGILHAFTLGMAPWEKESTRLHWVAYIRGILFHIGVFMAFGVFFISPWLAAIPFLISGVALLVTAVGAIAGFAGIVSV
jgi:hypothetical protein